MITLLYAGNSDDWDTYAEVLPKALTAKGIKANLTRDCDPTTVDYIIYTPNGPVQDFSPFTNLKAVLNLWAGVEKIEGNETLKVPLCRMVDSGLREGMTEWVTGHTLRYHLGMDSYILQQDGVWRNTPPPLARNRTVGFLGLGELGQSSAKALIDLNFNVLGWSRRQKTIPDMQCFSGEDGLTEILCKSEILVLLLPQTPATHHILNAKSLQLLPQGAQIINPGRGPLIDDDALLAALNTGHIAHATLDVFNVEPLPPEHPYWAHKAVTVTPHIASETRASTAAEVIAENVSRGESGQKFLYQVDRAAKY
ncbi:MAG: glyoxylate/hydroxypyruvate reductase A [Rhodobacteraceae bacterium]|nr:glyoxylate/hydroxypyruvate reductase A [Paracoccaceae bacterium]